MQYSSIGRSVLGTSIIGVSLSDFNNIDDEVLNYNIAAGINHFELEDENIYPFLLKYLNTDFRRKFFLSLSLNNPEEFLEFTDDNMVLLKKDYIDLILVNLESLEHKSDMIISRLIELQSSGRILNIGAINPSINLLKNYNIFDVVSINYSFLERDNEENRIVDYCFDNRIKIIAKSEKFFDTQKESEVRYSIEEIMSIKELNILAKKYGISIPQLNILWTLKRPAITHVLNSYDENLNPNLSNIDLKYDDIRHMNRIYNKYFCSELVLYNS